jgi:hypothetical protein
MLKILASILFVVATAAAQTTLSGSLGTLTLDSSGSPYTVTGNLIVGQGKVLTIGPGCVLLFKPYCGIEVSGELMVQGTAEKPVVFTSVNDDKWNRSSEKSPEAFYWNGIRVLDKGRALMSRFLVSYSVYGVQSQSEDIMVNEGVFSQNGQFNFTLSGKILDVQENLPFNYDGRATKGSSKGQPARPHRVTAICLDIAGAGSAIGSIPFFSKASQANREGNAAMVQSEINTARDRESSSIVTASILCGTAGAFVATAVVLWVKDKRKHESAPAVTIVPSIGRGSAAMRVAMTF